MSTVPAYLPQFDSPFRLTTDGSIATVEQDSAAEIDAAIYNIVTCPEGAKLGDESFGIPYPVFELLDIDVSAVANAVQVLEPRATVDVAQEAILQISHPQAVTLDIQAESGI